ncbi:MAG: hypothetical protein KAQ75_09715 [Bacteroidales bacterium]|nr:hypothetical protein [Bacteroidales bacterium]
MKILKNIKLVIFANIFLLILSSNAFSQKCHRFHHHNNCWTKDVKKDFKQYGQARSAVLEINKSFSYQAIFYGKKDFKILVCTENGYYPIHYRLINAETKEVFYDNAEDDYVEYVGFTMEKNSNLIIEVTVLAEEIEPEAAEELRICTGIQIIWRKIPQIGF